MLIRNLFFLFSITLFATASTVLNIFNYNPYQAPFSVFINFYASLFVAMSGIIAIVIYYLKIKLNKSKAIYIFFWPSVRQAIIFSLILTALLVLQGLRLLDWWIGIPLMFAVILLELFFQTNISSKKIKRAKNELLN